jgi:short-subunit dehydrogenase
VTGPTNARILVTGGGRGLGRAIATALAAPGRRIALLGRNRTGLAATAEALAASDVENLIVVGDIADPEARAACVAAVEERWGGLDWLVNNAGLGYGKPFLEHSPHEIEQVFAVNLIGLVQLTHALLPLLLRSPAPHIVNIASDIGRRPIGRLVPYVAAKHGVVGFSHALRLELREQGVKVGVVLPGAIDTNFNDRREGSRPGSEALRPADVAAAVVSMLHQSPTAQIDELTLHPMGQDA